MSEQDLYKKLKRKQLKLAIERLKTEPIQKQKEQQKQLLEKYIKQKQEIEQQAIEKQKKQLSGIEQLRQEYPELTDREFRDYAITQLGLKIPESAIPSIEADTKSELIKKRKARTGSKPVEIITPQANIQERKIVEEAIKQRKAIEELKTPIKITKKSKAKQTEDFNNKIDELKKIINNDPNFFQSKTGRPSTIRKDADKLLYQIKSYGFTLPQELLDIIEPIKEKKPQKKKAVQETDKKAQEAEKAQEKITTKPSDTIPLNENQDNLRIAALSILNNVKNSKDQNELNNESLEFSNIISQLSDLKTNKGILDELEQKFTELKYVKDQEFQNGQPNQSDQSEEENLLHASGFSKNKKKYTTQLATLAIHPRHIIETPKEFKLSKFGHKHAKILAGILHPKALDHVLSFSILNKVRNQHHKL